MSALQNDLDAVRVNFTATKSSVATADSKLDQLCAENRRLSSPGLDLTFTIDSLRLQLSNLQSSTSSAARNSLRCEWDRNLYFLSFKAGQSDRLDIHFATLVLQVRDSRSTFCRDVGSLFVEFRALLDEDDVAEAATVPFSTN